MLPYIELGSDINASGHHVVVYCLMDPITHEQIGEAHDTAKEAWDVAVKGLTETILEERFRAMGRVGPMGSTYAGGQISELDWVLDLLGYDEDDD